MTFYRGSGLEVTEVPVDHILIPSSYITGVSCNIRELYDKFEAFRDTQEAIT